MGVVEFGYYGTGHDELVGRKSHFSYYGPGLEGWAKEKTRSAKRDRALSV